MYRGLSVIGLVPVLNEQSKIGDVCRRTPRDVVDELLVIDNGSTDGSVEVALEEGATVLPADNVAGVGAALRAGYEHAVDKGFDIAVTMAGNNKDFPEQIPVLLDPIVEDRADFVIGSRWLDPGADFGQMPAYRRPATRLHALLFSLVAGRKVTESTNGFRAVTTRAIGDERLHLDQEWLNHYELETYLYLKLIRLGYRTAEVPVSKVYPPRELGQTKIKPVTGWWSVLRPLVYMGFHIKG